MIRLGNSQERNFQELTQRFTTRDSSMHHHLQCNFFIIPEMLEILYKTLVMQKSSLDKAMRGDRQARKSGKLN